MVHGGTIVSSKSVARSFYLVSPMTCVSCAQRDTLVDMCRARDGTAV